MSEETKGKALEVAATSRRTFVKTAGQVAVTAPAVALLLNATGKSAMAQSRRIRRAQTHILDDFTFGNTRRRYRRVRLRPTSIHSTARRIRMTTSQSDVIPRESLHNCGRSRGIVAGRFALNG